MKPARIGSIMPKASPPMVLKKAAAGIEEPYAAVPRPGWSTRNAIAVRMPPPITKGSMWLTPFMRCLYITCQAESFSPAVSAAVSVVPSWTGALPSRMVWMSFCGSLMPAEPWVSALSVTPISLAFFSRFSAAM